VGHLHVAGSLKYLYTNFQAVCRSLLTEGQYSAIRLIPRHIAHPPNLMMTDVLHHPLKWSRGIPRVAVSTNANGFRCQESFSSQKNVLLKKRKTSKQSYLILTVQAKPQLNWAWNFFLQPESIIIERGMTVPSTLAPKQTSQQAPEQDSLIQVTK
jgi:hypothetical protein